MSLATDLLAMLGGLLDVESVTYTPSGGSPRTIQAAVRRAEPQPEFLGGGEIPTIRYLVTVANDATLGVSAPTVGADTLALKLHVGDVSLTTCRLSRVLHEDPGSYTLEVVA